MEARKRGEARRVSKGSRALIRPLTWRWSGWMVVLTGGETWASSLVHSSPRGKWMISAVAICNVTVLSMLPSSPFSAFPAFSGSVLCLTTAVICGRVTIRVP